MHSKLCSSCPTTNRNMHVADHQLLICYLATGREQVVLGTHWNKFFEDALASGRASRIMEAAKLKKIEEEKLLRQAAEGEPSREPLGAEW